MVSCTGLLPAGAVLSSTFHYHMHFLTLLVTEAIALQPHHPKVMVWAPSVSLAATKEMPGSCTVPASIASTVQDPLLVSIPPGTKMFQFPGFTS